MISLRKARDIILLSYDQRLLSDEQFILLYDSYKPQLPCDLYPSFELDEMEDDECVAELRVRRRGIPLLADVTWHMEEKMELI